MLLVKSTDIPVVHGLYLEMNNPEALLNQAFQLHRSGRLPDAINLYKSLLRSNWNKPYVLLLIGTAYCQSGDPETGMAFLRDSANIDPNNALTFYNLGNALKDINKDQEAVGAYDRAIAINPNYDEALSNRGLSLQKLSRYEEALESHQRAISLNPNHPYYLNNYGSVLKALGRLDEAVEAFDKAIALMPNYAEAYNNRGIVLREQRKLDAALADYNNAIELAPNNCEASLNKALLLLLLGEYVEGWKLYESRFMRDDLKDNYYSFQEPTWRGHVDIRGKRLLIYSEQGFGDVIQFCRYLPKVASLGADIIFEIPKSLVSLMTTLNCQMTIVAKGEPLPKFEAYCPIMSLPYAFNSTLETIPTKVPYLFCDGLKVQKWQQKLGAKNQLRVGLVWSGSANNMDDKKRSIQLKYLLPLAVLPIELHSIQKEYREQDLDSLAQIIEIKQHQEDLEDFSDTASLIECMDLILCVDSSVAHLAGAIGKPIWVMLPYMPSDYRWMLDRDDSPWYPSARLFRQPSPGDWASVIAMVIDELKKIALH